MTAPLKTTFNVACSADHAFSVWTSRIATWWPPDHTVSGQPGLIVMQGVVGGRIFERAKDGVEHEWGEVTRWQPPSRLAYLWHLGGDRTVATEVDIRFVPQGVTVTRIVIEHRGWERLGPTGDAWRERNRAGWDSLIPHFIAEVTKGEQ